MRTDEWLGVFYIVVIYLRDIVDKEINGYYLNIIQENNFTGLNLATFITDEIFTDHIEIVNNDDLIYQYLENKNTGR